MKAAVLFAPNDLRVTDFPEPEPADNDVKIAVAYCGLCGTDFHKYAGKAGSRPVTYPVPLGHEISGIVVETGKNVDDIRPGDRVTVDPNRSCGFCWYCRNGKRHLCSNSRGVVKGMAEYVCAPRENVYRLPDTLSLRDAALTEPLSCCLHGVDLLDVKLGETVAIIGMGAIGQLMLQLLRHSSAASIVVIEPMEEKRKAALDMGATLFINPNTENILETLENNQICCVEKVVECVGLSSTAATALEIAGRGATVVLFGVSDAQSIVPMRQYEVFQKELTVKSSYVNPDATNRSICLLASGALNNESMISKVLELEDLPDEIVTRRYSRLGKVLVRIGPEKER